jgi:PIN like domain
MRFFFDRNMSAKLARMVDIYERDHQVRHLDDDSRFCTTTTDIEWIKVLGQDEPPWVAVSGDGRILRNKTEAAALKEAKLTFFCMAKTWTHMGIHEYAWRFLKIWPDIVENAKVATPRIFNVAGKVEIYR